MLGPNLKYLRKQKKRSQEEVAKAIEISRSTLADYENEKSEPIGSVLKKFSDFFGVRIDELLTTNLSMPLFYQRSLDLKGLQNENVRVLPITILEDQKQNIELVKEQALAGYATGYGDPEFVRELPRFTLPHLTEGTYRAFEIKGDSMPPIEEGYFVIGKYVESWEGLKNGQRYILVLGEGGVVFKRIVNEVEKNRRVILFSDNPSYVPYSVNIQNISEAWEMVAFVGYSHRSNDSALIAERLHAIEQQLLKLSTVSSSDSTEI